MKKLTLCFCILAMAHLHALAQTFSVSLTPSNYNGVNISCFGTQDGSVTTSITGGTAPFSYRWSNGETTANINGVAAGFYEVVVNDANMNYVETQITLTEPEPLVIEELTPYIYSNGYNVSAYGACNGSATTTINGGTAPYIYLWEPGQQTVLLPTNLCANENVLKITDANGCGADRGVALSEPERDDWTMNGNWGSNPATQFLGTTDNKDFVFKTNSTERLRLKGNGDIKLNGWSGMAGMVNVDDNGILYSSNADNAAAPCTTNPIFPIWSSYSQTTGHPPILWTCPTIDVAIGSFSLPPSGFKFNVYGNSYFQSNVSIGSASTATGIRFLVSGKSYFNGDVGIGTNNPIGIFEAKGTNPYLYVTESGSSTASINLKNSSGYWHISGPRGGSGSSTEIESPLSFYWNASVRVMSLLKNGTVYIGSTTPDATFMTNYANHKLLVDGSIAAREVRVKTGTWPDYVFAGDYKLKNLNEIEEFINNNNHLPGFDSAKQIEQDGQNLGQLQILQQEKLEELYLYMIALEKRFKELEVENKKLRSVK